MKIKLNKSLIKGSIILLIAFNIYNALNFFFHFAMVRLMTVVEYGILATLFSIIYMLAVFSESIQTVITKYTAKEENKGKLKNIVKRAFRKSFTISTSIFLFYLVISIPLSSMLKITYPLMALNGLIIFLVFFTPITRGIMQGKKRFTPLGINMIIESAVKFTLAIVLVLIGLSVYGALLGTIIGVAIALALSFISIKDVMKSKEQKAETTGIYGYTKPAFLIMLAILAFYSIDVIIAKVYFTEEIAGVYAIASILAKTIFFGTQPISRAMFPLSAEKRSDKNSENIFINALSLLFAAIIIALLIFYFFPELILNIFSGKSLPEAISILFYLGIAVSLISLTNLILLYKLSLGKIKGYMYLFVFIGIEILLLSYFSKDLVQFSLALVTASTAFLWGSIILMNE
jgi:stage V sporulation protein B